MINCANSGFERAMLFSISLIYTVCAFFGIDDPENEYKLQPTVIIIHDMKYDIKKVQYWWKLLKSAWF